MKIHLSILCLLAVIPFLVSEELMSQNLWVGGYYRTQREVRTPTYPVSAVRFSAMSHIMHFSIWPRTDAVNGGIDENGVTAIASSNLINASNRGTTKIYLTIGGQGSGSGFNSQISAHFNTFIEAIRGYLARGYHGLDIDWEPIDTSDRTNYIRFIKGLDSAFTAHNENYEISTVFPLDPGNSSTLSFFTTVVGGTTLNQLARLKQINLMTYDWGTLNPIWFNAPLKGRPLSDPAGTVWHISDSANIDHFVKMAIGKGISPGKLGVGIKVNSYLIQGGRQQDANYHVISNKGIFDVGQSFKDTSTHQYTPQPVSDPDNINGPGDYPYYALMNLKYTSTRYRYDQPNGYPSASQAYLSYEDSGNPDNDFFGSYDNQRVIKEKMDYCRSTGISGGNAIGGVIIWEIGGAYLQSNSSHLLPGGFQDSLLRTAESVLLGPGVASTLLGPSNNATGVLNPVTFQWSSVIGVSQYTLKYWITGTSDTNNVTVYDSTLSLPTISTVVYGLGFGTPYQWKVIAQNSGGSTSSTVWAFTTVNPHLQSNDNFATNGNGQRKIVRNGASLYLVYEDHGTVWFSSSSNRGSSWSSDVKLSDANYSTHPAISATGSNLYVVWQVKAGSAWTIKYRYSNNGGGTWSSVIVLPNASSFSCPDPGPLPVVQSSTGTSPFSLMVVYQNSSMLQYAFDSTTTAPASTNWRTYSITGTTSSSQNPCLAISSGSTFNVSWSNGSTSWFQQYTSPGPSWTTPASASNLTTGYNCSMAISGNGDNFIAWQEDVTPGGFSSPYKRIGVNRNRSQNYTTFAPSPTAWNYYQGAVLSGHSGSRATIIWYNMYFGFTPWGLYKSVFDGVSSWSAPVQLTTNGPLAMYPTLSVNNAPGDTAYAYWTEHDNGSSSYKIATSSSGGPLRKIAPSQWSYSRQVDLGKADSTVLSVEMGRIGLTNRDGSSQEVNFAPMLDTVRYTVDDVWRVLRSSSFSIAMGTSSIDIPVSAFSKATKTHYMDLHISVHSAGSSVSVLDTSLALSVHRQSLVGMDSSSEVNLLIPTGLEPGSYFVAVQANVEHPDSITTVAVGQNYREGGSMSKNTAKGEKTTKKPKQFSLSQNYPNPFNPQTNIQYSVAEPGHVKLAVFDVLGRMVRMLVDEVQTEAGARTVQFDGASLASGVYFYRLESGRNVQVKKLLLMK